MKITNFRYNTQGPLEIRFPNEKNVQISLALEWQDVNLDTTDAIITYSVEGNTANVCFDNRTKTLDVNHKDVIKTDTIHELLTFSMSGNNNPPTSSFELKAKATIGTEITSEKIIIIEIKES